MTREDEWFLVKDCFQSDVRGVLGDGTVQFLGGGFKYVLFSPLFGEDFQFVEHIFQMGGSTTNQFFFAYILRFGKKCIFS